MSQRLLEAKCAQKEYLMLRKIQNAHRFSRAQTNAVCLNWISSGVFLLGCAASTLWVLDGEATDVVAAVAFSMKALRDANGAHVEH